MGYTNPEKVIMATTEKTMINIEQRNHVFIDGTYQNKESTLVINFFIT